jgi:hypothetical protein
LPPSTGRRQRARPSTQRIELLRRLFAVFRRKRRRREITLEHLRRLFGLVEPNVTLRDVPQLEGRPTEPMRFFEIPNRVVEPTIAIGLRPLLIEDPRPCEVLLATRGRTGRARLRDYRCRR